MGYGLGYLAALRIKRLRFLKRAGMYMATAAACAVFLVYVYQRVETVEQGYKVESLKSSRDELARVNELLRVEVATLSSPSRIEKTAASMLDMRVPKDSQVVMVKEIGPGSPGIKDNATRLVRKSTSPGNS